MGLDLKPLLVREKTQLESFTNKVVAIDAYNAIYQFLAIIRGPEGLHLTDSQGRVTSHITGLLFRNIISSQWELSQFMYLMVNHRH